jgi:Immunity protein Imm1
MRKTTYFASQPSLGWPDPHEIEHFFLAPPGQRWFFETDNDSAGFTGEGADGTEHLPANRGRIDINLRMWGHPQLGVLLIYSKWGGGLRQTYSSKGDVSRLRQWVRSTHDTPLPVGLFIPFERAWTAVKEFIETDGALPNGIEWIASKDLPPDTFPDP